MGTYDIEAIEAWDRGTIRVAPSILDNEHVYMDRGIVGYSPLGGIQIPLEVAESIVRELLSLVGEARESQRLARHNALLTEPVASVVRIVTSYDGVSEGEYVAARVREGVWVVTGSESAYSWEDLIEYLTLDENETIVSVTPLKEGK